MKNKFLILISILSFMFLSCASVPGFQKQAAKGFGYSSKELSNKDHIEVVLHLPDNTPSMTFEPYAWRAVGEECRLRGFNYFDLGDHSETRFEGFCYTERSRKALAVTFTKEGLEQTPRAFIVQDLNGKDKTLLKVGDVIELVSGIKPASMAHIKSIIFQDLKPTIVIKLRRGQKTLKVTEPLAKMTNANQGPDSLETLRDHIR